MVNIIMFKMTHKNLNNKKRLKIMKNIKIMRVDDRLLPTYRSKEELEELMAKNILIGFPRSGNTAIRLFIEKYTNKPTGRPLIINGMSIGTDTGSSVLFSHASLAEAFDVGVVLTKIHRFWELDLLKTDKIIYLIRDYHDCVPSILRFDDNKIFAGWLETKDKKNYGFDSYAEFINFLIDMSFNYGEQLRQFHFIPNNKKMVIYYEDFINNFEQEAKRLLGFLEIEIDVDEIRRNNIIGSNGRKITDEYFHRLGKDNTQINFGCTNFVNEYNGVLGDKEIEILKTLFKRQLGERLYKYYLGRYE